MFPANRSLLFVSLILGFLVGVLRSMGVVTPLCVVFRRQRDFAWTAITSACVCHGRCSVYVPVFFWYGGRRDTFRPLARSLVVTYSLVIAQGKFQTRRKNYMRPEKRRKKNGNSVIQNSNPFEFFFPRGLNEKYETKKQPTRVHDR